MTGDTNKYEQIRSIASSSKYSRRKFADNHRLANRHIPL